MARLMTFKTVVQESITNNDAKEFQNIVKKKLLESLRKEKKNIIRLVQEELDANFSKATEIGNASKSYGAKKFIYEDGILHIVVPTHDAVEHLADYLEESDDVDSYEVHALVEDSSGTPVDLDVAMHNPETNFEFTIYFKSEDSLSESRAVFLEEKDEDDDDEDDDDEDEDDEDEDDDKSKK